MKKLTAERAVLSELSPYKKWQTKWSIAAGIVFPGMYSVGISNLGYQCLFANIFDMDFVKPMRFFYDIEGSLDGDLAPDSLPVLFFSIPFELDYQIALKMLKRWNIGLSPDERDENSPVLVCGGAAPTLNPKIASGIFDIVVEGDLNSALPLIENGMRELLANDGRQRFINSKTGINRRNDGCPKRPPEYSRIVSSFAAFRNMFLVEIQNSCNFRCGFCATPNIYGDFYNFDKDEILKIVEEYNPGVDRIGLVGSAIAEHPELTEIVSSLAKKNFKISTSSIRMDRIDQNVLDILHKSGANSITLAPETHIPSLFAKIGKNISADEIIGIGTDLPFKEIKLYYIIGFEGESLDDVRFLAETIGEIAKALPTKTLSISINPFIPKPGTRLFSDGMQDDETLKAKFTVIKKTLAKARNIKLTLNYSHRQRLEALIASADRDFAGILIEAVNGRPIKNALKMSGIDINDRIIGKLC